MSQDLDSKRRIRCWACRTPLLPQNGVEPHGGVSIEQFICKTCGRHWYGGERQRPPCAAELSSIPSALTPPAGTSSNEP
jgi:hypothetical protein